MKIKSSSLRKMLELSRLATKSRTTLPVLSMTRITCAGNNLELVATDLEKAIRISAECSGEMGSCCASPALVAAFLPAGDSDVEINLENSWLKINAQAKVKLPTMLAEDMPDLKFEKKGVKLTVDNAVFIAAIKQVSYAISTDAARFVLSFIHILGNGKNLIIEATDGRKLARVVIPCADKIDFLIHPEVKLLDEVLSEKDAEIYIAENSISIISERRSCSMRLGADRFPNCSQVIPMDGMIGKVDRDAVIAAIRTVQTVTTEKAQSITVSFEKSAIAISHDGPGGEAIISVPCKFSKVGKIAFNPNYLASAIANLGEEIEVHFTDAFSGLKLICGNATTVIMPMRLS